MSTLFWVNVAVGALLVAVTAAVAPVLAWFYSEPRLVAITLAVAPTFLIVSLTVQHQALLRRQMRFGVSSTIAIVSSLVGLLVGAGMAWWGSAYWALVAMTIAMAATNMIAAWIAAPWRPGPPVRGVGARELVRFGTHVTGTNLLNYFSRRLDHLLLGWWWGATVLGLYTKANSLVETPWSRALTPVGTVVLPSLSRLASEPERYRASFLRIFEKLSLVVLPGAAFMIASAGWLIPFLLGERWADAAPIFGALAVLGVARPVEVASLWLFMTQNRADQALRWSTFAGLIAAGAVLAGLPWGGLGVAVALATVGLARIPLLVWYMTRTGPVRASDFYRSLGAPALASAGALLVLTLLNPKVAGMPPALVLLLGMVVTAAVAMVILLILPSGRSALADAWSLLPLLRRQRPV